MPAHSSGSHSRSVRSCYWGPADFTPAPWELGVLEGQPLRNRQSPGGGVGVPTSLPVLPTPQPPSTHTYPLTGLQVSAAPLRSIRSDSPPPLDQPEGGLCRRRRHVPKETAGSQ